MLEIWKQTEKDDKTWHIRNEDRLNSLFQNAKIQYLVLSLKMDKNTLAIMAALSF